MTAPYARIGFPRETNLAELYHENTKIHPYMRDAEEDPMGVDLDLLPPTSLSYTDPEARIPLPAPMPVDVPLGDAIRTRRTRRGFTGEPLALAELSTLLSLAYGVTGPIEPTGEPGRAAPSAGGRYPLEFFPVALRVDGIAPAIHHYHPETHSLEPLPGPLPEIALRRALFDMPWLEHASVVLLVGAVFPRTLAKYRERGYRLVLLDAGHAVQNLLLAAHGLGLGAVPMGGFVDDELNTMAGLNGVDENVLCAVALGRL
jgi:SagB-type dehydrogenase family enzyme